MPPPHPRGRELPQLIEGSETCQLEVHVGGGGSTPCHVYSYLPLCTITNPKLSNCKQIRVPVFQMVVPSPTDSFTSTFYWLSLIERLGRSLRSDRLENRILQSMFMQPWLTFSSTSLNHCLQCWPSPCKLQGPTYITCETEHAWRSYSYTHKAAGPLMFCQATMQSSTIQ